MIAAMLAAVLASTMGGVSVPAVGSVASVATTDGASPARNIVAPDDEPAVRVTLNSTNVYDPGDRARVRVHVRDDSYLVVLHADPSGIVHVLFPTNPGDDNFIHANTDVDVQGSGMDASFVVANTRGTGTVYAAVSRDPFHFDAFSNASQWAANDFPDTARAASAEAVMTDVVQRMATPGGRFDYDLVTYTVTPHRGPPSNTYANGPDQGAYVPDWGPYGPYYDPWYDPWYGPEFGLYFGGPWWGYSPWYYGYGPGFYGAGFGLGFGLGFGGCWGCGYGFYGGYYGYPGYFHGPFLHRPGLVPPVGYVTHGALFAARPGLGTGYVSGGLARPAVFASARVTTAPGGIARSALYHGATSPTVFRQVRSASQVAQPGLGRVVASNEAAGAARATAVGPAERASLGERAVGTRVGGTGASAYRVSSSAGSAYRAGASAYRAPARAYRVTPQARAGSEGGYGSVRGGGAYSAARGGGGGGGGGYRASGGYHGGGGGHGGGHR